MKKLYIIFILFLSGADFLHGQDVKVTAKVDTSKILLGDQVYYTITVDQPSDMRLDIPAHRDTLCRNIDIISGPSVDSTVTGNRIRIRNKYLITSFDSGYYFIPPAYAEMKTPNTVKRFFSEYTILEVVRVKTAPGDTTAKIYDIIKPYRAPLTFSEILPYILAGLAAVAALWGIIILIRKLRKPVIAESPVINPDPAHVIAFRELEELFQQQLWQKGEVKLYYSRLTEILRKYLENRFGVYSMEMTTSETLEALLKTGFKKDSSYEGLKNILNGSDLVKFAKYKPDSSENEGHYSGSWRFVEQTMKKEEPVDQNVGDKNVEAGS